MFDPGYIGTALIVVVASIAATVTIGAIFPDK
jgi:hypothetical protein